MTASDTSTELPLEPPGPGSWEQDPVHFPRPMTRYFQETHAPSFKRGTNDFARFYGMLIDGLQIAYVQGFAYNQVLPTLRLKSPNAFSELNRSSRRDFGGNSFATGTRIANRPPSPHTGSCRASIQTPFPTPSWWPI